MFTKLNIIKTSSFAKLFTKNGAAILTRSMSETISEYTSIENIIQSTRKLEYPKEDLFTFFKKRVERYGDKTVYLQG